MVGFAEGADAASMVLLSALVEAIRECVSELSAIGIEFGWLVLWDELVFGQPPRTRQLREARRGISLQSSPAQLHLFSFRTAKRYAGQPTRRSTDR